MTLKLSLFKKTYLHNGSRESESVRASGGGRRGRRSEQELVTKAQTQGQRGWLTERSDHLSEDL